MYKITLAHLYPKLLNIYGDLGNITAIKMRCAWRNIDVEIVNIDVNDKIDSNKYDFYFMGGGQDTQQILVANELLKQKDALVEAMNQNSVFLAICGGYQLLGEFYQPYGKDKLDGVGLLDVYTIAGENRFIGNVTAECKLIKPKTLVGFENHSGLTYIVKNSPTKPLAEVVMGAGNNNEDGFEGAYKKNVFGTYLHGSLLPKNPAFADYLISLALQKKYRDKINLNQLNDNIENMTHEALVEKDY